MTDLKPGWMKVEFGEVAVQVKDRVSPEDSGLQRYVAGGHMDTDELCVRRWGCITTDDLGPAFHMRFRPKHVLYGSRRTYLRKVALADFSGICANTTFVIKSHPDSPLHPELLPFLMSSERFHAHAIKQSKGSVNPYVNFSDLTWFEVDVPPRPYQESLLGRLKAIEKSMDAVYSVSVEAKEALAATSHSWATAHGGELDDRGHVLDKDLPEGWTRQTIRDLCSGDRAGLTLGPFGSSLRVADYGHLDEGTPVLFVADVRRYNLGHKSAKFISPAKHEELRAHEAVPGDVLVTEMGWPPGETCVVPEGWPASIIKADLIRARTNRASILPEYLTLVLNSNWGQQQLVRISPGTTRPRMTLRDFEAIRIAVPPLQQQQLAVEACDELLLAIESARARRAATREVRRALLSSVWSET